MTTAVRDFSYSARTTMPFLRTLSVLREALKRNGFEVLGELPLHLELTRKVGLRCQPYTVLVVWSPFDAYQAVLSDRDGGLLVPFNITVAQHGETTMVAATNHSHLSLNDAPIGVRILAQALGRKVRRLFFELAMQESVSDYPVAKDLVANR